MDKFKEIRPIVIGIPRRDGKVLVQEGQDNSDKSYYYRCLGGGIEFLEKSEEALKREFMEEVGAEIRVNELVGIFENIFTLRGKSAHEIVFVYNVDFPELVYKENYIIKETEKENPAKWIDIMDFKEGKKKIYPEGFERYL